MSAYANLPLEAWEEKAREVCGAIDQKVPLSIHRSKAWLSNFSFSSYKPPTSTSSHLFSNKDPIYFYSPFSATSPNTQRP